jgi:division protein CdvB (Snf7/Vps24/ESCRT-III family)
MAIVPPLDEIPKLAGKLTNQLVELGLKETDKLIDKSLQVVQDSIQIPVKCKCDDPKIKKLKQDLQTIQQQISRVQQTIPKIQQVVNATKTVVSIAQSVKTAITVAQLSNPVTAPLFIAQQLQAIQDATITNALTCIEQLQEYPTTLIDKLPPLVMPPIQEALQKISSVCNGETPDITMLSNSGSVADINTYNDLYPSEFYREINVSEQDLLDRATTIQTLITRQLDVLSNLQEAPSMVFQQQGKPANNVGKLGDYYVDTQNLIFYGPKLSDTEWPPGINY